MNVLVIGGSGLFGGKTLVHLLQDEEVSSVVSMDVAPPKEWFMRYIERYTDKFHFIRGDVSQLEDILNAMRLFSIDKVVNLAFVLIPEVNFKPRLATKVNALGMCNVFEAARLMGVSRVIYSSSVGVYGAQPSVGGREITEDDGPQSDSSYALCKRLAEVLADQYTQLDGMSFTGLRPAVGYGYGGQSPSLIKLLSDMIDLPATGKPVSVKVYDTSDTPAVLMVSEGGRIPLVSADDVGAFTRILLHSPSSKHPVYNLAGPSCSLRDVADAVRRYIPDAKIEFGNQPVLGPGSGGGPPLREYSCARAREDFGFSLMPLEEAVLVHINDARFVAGLEPIKGHSHT